MYASVIARVSNNERGVSVMRRMNATNICEERTAVSGPSVSRGSVIRSFKHPRFSTSIEIKIIS